VVDLSSKHNKLLPEGDNAGKANHK